jgi:hypothetical protein
MIENLPTLLQKASKDSLIDFLTREAEKDASLARRLHIAFGEETISPNVDVRRILLQESLTDLEYDSYGDLGFSQESEQFLDSYFHDIEVAIAHTQFSYAIQLCILLDETLPLLQHMDYQYEMLYGRLKQCCNAIADAVIPFPYKQSLYVFLSDYDNLTPTRIRLMTAMITEDKQAKQLREMILEEGSEVEELTYGLLLRTASKEEQLQYLLDHGYEPEFWKLSIEKAIQEESKNEAIELAQEANERFKYSHIFSEYLLKLYKEMGNRQGALDAAFDLIIKGESHYVTELKALSKPDSWKTTLELLCDAMEGKSFHVVRFLPELLIEEGYYERLLWYVKQFPKESLRYYEYLVPSYTVELIELLVQQSLHMVNEESSRYAFTELANTLQVLKSIGGEKEMLDCIDSLLEQYPKKMMLKQEIRKAGLL